MTNTFKTFVRSLSRFVAVSAVLGFFFFGHGVITLPTSTGLQLVSLVKTAEAAVKPTTWAEVEAMASQIWLTDNTGRKVARLSDGGAQVVFSTPIIVGDEYEMTVHYNSPFPQKPGKVLKGAMHIWLFTDPDYATYEDYLQAKKAGKVKPASVGSEVLVATTATPTKSTPIVTATTPVKVSTTETEDDALLRSILTGTPTTPTATVTSTETPILVSSTSAAGAKMAPAGQGTKKSPLNLQQVFDAPGKNKTEVKEGYQLHILPAKTVGQDFWVVLDGNYVRSVEYGSKGASKASFVDLREGQKRTVQMNGGRIEFRSAAHLEAARNGQPAPASAGTATIVDPVVAPTSSEPLVQTTSVVTPTTATMPIIRPQGATTGTPATTATPQVGNTVAQQLYDGNNKLIGVLVNGVYYAVQQ